MVKPTVIMVILIGILISLIWFFSQASRGQNPFPHRVECPEDFKEGITTRAGIELVLGKLSSTGTYRTDSRYDVGCKYLFDQNDILQKVLIYSNEKVH